MNVPVQVLGLIRAQSAREVPPGIRALAAAARERHGESVRAVLLYGSCLRTGNVHDGLADLYLLVDDYRTAFNGRTLALLNSLLPPNVFFLEVQYQDHLLRAKYAVLSLADFHRGTERWFHSYLWGRFSQPAVLIYAHNEHVAHQINRALATAAMIFVTRTLPQMEAAFTPRDLWARGLALCYHTELRTEKPEGLARLFDADPEYYQALTCAVLDSATFVDNIRTDVTATRYQVEFSPQARRLNKAAWRVRTLQGKILSALRLLKGLLTFKGGVDYILWKIERHSGVKVEVGPNLKRLPPLAIVVIFWRLYRRDAFR
jgi:predicted nucleotidyltransferase